MNPRLQTLVNRLKANDPTLTVLPFASMEGFIQDDYFDLARAIENNSRLQTIELKNMDAPSLLFLLEGMMKCQSLRVLRINGFAKHDRYFLGDETFAANGMKESFMRECYALASEAKDNMLFQKQIALCAKDVGPENAPEKIRMGVGLAFVLLAKTSIESLEITDEAHSLNDFDIAYLSVFLAASKKLKNFTFHFSSRNLNHDQLSMLLEGLNQGNLRQVNLNVPLTAIAKNGCLLAWHDLQETLLNNRLLALFNQVDPRLITENGTLTEKGEKEFEREMVVMAQLKPGHPLMDALREVFSLSRNKAKDVINPLSKLEKAQLVLRWLSTIRHEEKTGFIYRCALRLAMKEDKNKNDAPIVPTLKALTGADKMISLSECNDAFKCLKKISNNPEFQALKPQIKEEGGFQSLINTMKAEIKELKEKNIEIPEVLEVIEKNQVVRCHESIILDPEAGCDINAKIKKDIRELREKKINGTLQERYQVTSDGLDKKTVEIQQQEKRRVKKLKEEELERQRLERERIAKEKIERERLEKERKENERVAKEKEINDGLIAAAKTGIEKYQKLNRTSFFKTHLNIFSFFFDESRGRLRADAYLRVLNSEHSQLEKLIVIYSLLKSKDGKTLKSCVSKEVGMGESLISHLELHLKHNYPKVDLNKVAKDIYRKANKKPDASIDLVDKVVFRP